MTLTPGQQDRIAELSDQWSFFWDKRRSLWLAAEDCPDGDQLEEPDLDVLLARLSAIAAHNRGRGKYLDVKLYTDRCMVMQHSDGRWLAGSGAWRSAAASSSSSPNRHTRGLPAPPPPAPRPNPARVPL